MKYFIMLGIVILMALFDWITGFIKAVVLDTVSSKVMRAGGFKKIVEVIVMIMAIVLDLGINLLSQYYPNSQELAALLGIVCAVVIFAYIVIMEVISILENYASIFPEAAWALKITRKLKNIEGREGTVNGKKEVE